MALELGFAGDVGPPPGFENCVPRVQWQPWPKPTIVAGEGSYELLGKLGEGSYGVVHCAKDRKTGELVAVKKVTLDNMAMREIEIMSCCRGHPSIIELKEVAKDGNNDQIVYLVMELAERDLRSLIRDKNRYLDEYHVCDIMHQLLRGVARLHSYGILHRDLKPSNLLICDDDEGGEHHLKIADFGLSRRLKHRLGRYTQHVGTLWYLAPELLLGTREYSTGIDMWSVGCIFAELVCREALFQGRRTEIDQLSKIYALLGQPDKVTRSWPEGVASRLRHRIPPHVLSPHGFDLLTQLLAFDPDRRITARQALFHPWFKELETT